MGDYFAIVLRMDKATNDSLVWKVVATSDLAETYVAMSDGRYLFRYEMWRVSGNKGGAHD